MELPKDFKEKMQNLLNDEYDDFLSSYNENKKQGLRVNTLKISVDQFKNISPFELEKIPWVSEGFFYKEKDKPGKHPYHEAGLYYIQEPSAMAVGEIISPNPGEKVLDLCAAPGGKTTHIASKMNQEGLIVANEIHPSRAKILSQNVERMGIKNVIVTNETPENLSKKFENYFDKILVDAPCSGEGMFRKNPEACSEWSLKNVCLCKERQLDILKCASSMLKVGGRLVYSTCTFSPEENEQVISEFVKENTNFEIEKISAYHGFDKGRKDWTKEGVEGIENTIRIWPHKIAGEGHYIASLRKIDGEDSKTRKILKTITDKKVLKDYLEFEKEFLVSRIDGNYILFGEELYSIPKDMVSLDGMKIVRPGLHIGTIKKNRFEPSHALALYLNKLDVKYSYNIDKDSQQIIDYLKGHALKINGQKGWYLVEVDGYSIGWGKLSGDTLKNHYPKGLRWI
ncbi:NOL1/NOP2/sun family putative RNA methylase [Alkalithermobacter thermoalcaliphilus JW-YL-7 = DSM 7308]|uniref:NOL1/NOP2/sun family putative RNA methylase n=1 Tax=Alkalithermobacter thermoalcaliphilus JW-YL-7 = DSM 7308 TaxID=1121328 RepID=A0A150FNQ0_CLOPD|nr:RNA methylase, NOL1/NOP2/sun family [[Clostridium] paradoxum JW-YL-7 = DSM 7308]SHK85919.1 NOL1/NOP2/sun family putative RNA methylase [[Clostridium] paradoxum JW-YL-7 = DSM 7308]